MRRFLDEDFLLSTDYARHLYHEYSEKLPIIDYHCHISPREIYEDRHFTDITQVWLEGDHYKWRQMRSNGIDEYYITGNAEGRKKFQAWADTMPKLIGNPLYHWSHLELKRYFGYDGILNGDTAEQVWQIAGEKLGQEGMGVRELITASNVKVICTTDDPADTLLWHEKLAGDPSFEVTVLPAWRPDKALHIERPDFPSYIVKLSEISGIEIHNFERLKEALRLRMDYFAQRGCVLSDHDLEYVMYAPADDLEIEGIFSKRMAGESVTSEEEKKYKTAFMNFAAGEYHKRDWVMQLHYGCRRNVNARMMDKIGPESGYDCIGDQAPMGEMGDYLNTLAAADQLPKTIIYSLNPNDNDAIMSIIGCFQECMPGKIQHGSAWWFNDHKVGMTSQLTALANLGCLGNFIGMLTDSRSFLSYTRHEYFRRILCELIGGWVEQGEYPCDEKALKEIVEGISYYNAVKYFGF